MVEHAMNCVYLVISENINSGLLKSQVIEPIDGLSGNKIKLINIHTFGNKCHEYKNCLNLPIAIPYKLFLFNYFYFLTPIFALFYALLLTCVVERNTVVVARSYFPSLVAFFLKKIKKIDFVFDSRSLFIDENTISGAIKKGGVNYRMWKYFEMFFAYIETGM